MAISSSSLWNSLSNKTFCCEYDFCPLHEAGAVTIEQAWSEQELQSLPSIRPTERRAIYRVAWQLRKVKTIPARGNQLPYFILHCQLIWQRKSRDVLDSKLALFSYSIKQYNVFPHWYLTHLGRKCVSGGRFRVVKFLDLNSIHIFKLWCTDIKIILKIILMTYKKVRKIKVMKIINEYFSTTNINFANVIHKIFNFECFILIKPYI